MRELPDGFEYIVNRFKIVEESSVPHESKFEAGFLVKVCDEEKQDKFIKSFECSTGTNFNLKWAKNKPSVKNWKHKLLKCSRNVREQMQVADTKMAGKGAGGEKIFVISKVQFHHEGGLSESRYFQLFFLTHYETPPHKKSAFTEPPFLLFLTFGSILSNFVYLIFAAIFGHKIWVITL